MKKNVNNSKEMRLFLILVLVFALGACDNTGSSFTDESGSDGGSSVEEPGAGNSISDGSSQERASLLFSEIKADLPDGNDLIELIVTSSGLVDGISIKENNQFLIETDGISGMTVTQGDVIIIHLNSDGSQINETASKDECTYHTAVSGVWDIWSTDSGLAATTIVLRLFNYNGVLMDAVVLASENADPSDKSTTTASSLGDQWSGSGIEFDDTTYMEHAVLGLDAAYYDSLQRDGTTDTNSKADWSLKDWTWGTHQ